jgi:hypothetical protein
VRDACLACINPIPKLGLLLVLDEPIHLMAAAGVK